MRARGRERSGRLGSRPRADLSLVIFPVLGALLFLGLLEQGLYFRDALLPMQVYVAVLALLVALDRLVHLRPAPLDRPLDWAVLAYAAGYGVAAAAHPAAPEGALLGALRAGMLCLWYWSAAHALGAAGCRLRWAQVVLGSAVVLAGIGCLALVVPVPFPFAVYGGRILSTLQYANALAAWLVVGAACALGLLAAAYRDAQRAARGLWAMAVYGACLALLILTLLGTYSRGGWVVFVLAVGLWLGGAPAELRAAVAAIAGWCTAVALLFSRGALAGLQGGSPAQTWTVLVATVVLGAAGAAACPWLVRQWHRQPWSPAVRRTLQGIALAYVLGVGGFLAVAGARAAAATGQGVLASSVVQRAADVGPGTPDFVQRVQMALDGWRLIRQRPVVGFGGGGWAALYHQVQASLYWASEAHSALLQAWVEGGILAAAGLLAMGLLLFVQGWRARAEPGPEGIAVWSLAVGGLALWLHALADFDLSLTALAMGLWSLAAAVRAPVSAVPPPAPPLSRRLGGAVAGAALLTGGALAVLGPSLRLDRAWALGTAAAAGMREKAYAQAFTQDLEAVRLDPLSPSFHADLGQLLLAAYEVNHERQTVLQAVDQERLAARLDPGNLSAQGAALNVLLLAGQWDDVHDVALGLLRNFPLDPQVYGTAGVALVQAAEGHLAEASLRSARADLIVAASLQERLEQAAARQGRGRQGRGAGPLPPEALRAQGQAEVLLGRRQEAVAPLARAAGAGDAAARAWLAANLHLLGDEQGATRQLAGDPRLGTEYRKALAYAAFAPDLAAGYTRQDSSP